MVRDFTTAGTGDTYNRAPEFRVFISSTFREMQRERDYLIRHVIPELRALCRERGVKFTESNPQWAGNTSDAERQGVVESSLNLIIRHNAFFIGIFDADYARIPVPSEQERQTLIEIEIAEEALKNMMMGDRAIFYLRDCANGMPGAGDSYLNERFAALMARVRLCQVRVRQVPAHPESLGDTILNDLRHVIDGRYPAGGALTMLERERAVHEAFAATRWTNYVVDEEAFATLDASARNEGTPVVVTGAPGAGKSALLANWVNHYRTHHPDAFVIEHYIGSSGGQTDHLDVLRRIMAEIKYRYGLADDLPAGSANIDDAALSWLAHVQRESLVLAIDGVDRLEGQSQRLDWLNHIQPNIRLIISSNDGPALEVMRGRGWRELPVKPLSYAERDTLVRQLLSRHGNPFNQQEIERFVTEFASFIPLTIVASLEELLKNEDRGEASRLIDEYLTAADAAGVYLRVLQDRERMFGRELVRDVMLAIWASRRGLAGHELLSICGNHDDKKIFHLLATLKYSLMNRGGLFTFFHDFLRQVVEECYLHGAGQRNEAHGRVGAYFRKQPINQRTIDELPWQLREARDIAGLAEWIGRLDVLTALYHDGREFELLTYWRDAEGAGYMMRRYIEQVTLAESGAVAGAHIVSTQIDVARALQLAGHLNAAMEVLEHALNGSEMSGADMATERITVLNMLGDIYQSKGEYKPAVQMFGEAWSECSGKFGEAHPQSARTLHHLATQHYLLREWDAAIEHFTKLESIRRRPHSDARELAGTLNDFGAVWFDKGNIYMAEAYFRESLRIFKDELGDYHPDMLEALNNLGAIFMNTEGNREAEPAFRDALRISERTFGATHMNIVPYLNNLALQLKTAGQFGEAEDLYLRALAIERKHFDAMDPRVANLLISIGSLYRPQKRYHEATDALTEALRIREHVFGEAHVHTAIAGLNLASLYKEMRSWRESEELYRKYTWIAIRMLGLEHALTVKAIGGLVNLLDIAGRPEEAMAFRFAYPQIFTGQYDITIDIPGIEPESTVRIFEYLFKHLEAVGRAEEIGAICARYPNIFPPPEHNGHMARNTSVRRRSVPASGHAPTITDADAQ